MSPTSPTSPTSPMTPSPKSPRSAIKASSLSPSSKRKALDAYLESPQSPSAFFAAATARRQAKQLADEVAADNATSIAAPTISNPHWPRKKTVGLQLQDSGTRTTITAPPSSPNRRAGPVLPPPSSPAAHDDRVNLYSRLRRSVWTGRPASHSGVLSSKSSSPGHPWGHSRRWTCCKCGAETIVEQSICARIGCEHQRCRDGGLGCKEKF